MDLVQFSAKLPNIAPGDLAEFKAVAGEAIERSRGEADTIQYDWFFNADETSCVIRETYANSDAVLAHSATVGDLIAKLAELGGGMELEVFGTPSPDLAAAVSALQPNTYTFFQGKR